MSERMQQNRNKIKTDAGGALLLRHQQGDIRQQRPLITASHGPYDPHTLEVTLYFLRTGKGGSAIINLGFAGREPLRAYFEIYGLSADAEGLNRYRVDTRILPAAGERTVSRPWR